MAIKNISANTLRQSVVEGFPSEATFQYILMQGFEIATTGEYTIFSEFSKFLPSEDERTVQSRGLDFLLNGKLRWVVELLVNGAGVEKSEHAQRFDAEKYTPFKLQDWAVVNFRQCADGEPTCMPLHKKHISVFFARDGDYSQCQMLFGTEESVETIELAQ